MSDTLIKVQDMSCGHCVATVQNALEQVDGVQAVEVSLDTKIARVSHPGEIDVYALMAAVEAAGFTPEVDS